MKKMLLGLVVVTLGFTIAGCSSNVDEAIKDESSSSYDFDSEFEKAKDSAGDDDLTADPDIEYVGGESEETSSVAPYESSSSSVEIQDNSVTREQRNALDTAAAYLDYSAFSKQGLYDQLIFEEYPADAAQYAIDNISADWNQNALQTAKDYLDFTSFSDQGLYDQLIHDKYTPDEAQFAINNLPS
ncbi:Ltp family lipoprotein [Enterococcus dongliensis]|uniref:Ltp family lipoprotein n=1 Tax=Enterococcus TaxID=1350 RepID=UPI00289006D0|nr:MULTISPECIES: Ltp family lipoprotein [Enterococcus]MDT2390987.1 Ltp family lipoprotein [Enterococcus avium]MDT2461821.1 Ltp family lipoprotein [Enterococcus avium]MDT2648077.1 Ltp family lipoprotein [Enterococcus dongliensis]